jgi:uncharacterized membrane protein YqjE
MRTATAKDKYNALLHAIWRIDRELRDNAELSEKERATLERDRNALSVIHEGLA